MSADHDLAGRVAATLEAYAGTVDVADEPFDPTWRMEDAPAPTSQHRSRRPRRHRPLLLAAAVIASVTAVAGAVVLDRGDDEARTATAAVIPPAAPTDGLAPTWVPDGWRLRSIGWRAPAEGLVTGLSGPSLNGIRPDGGDRAQLFGDPDDPARKLLVEWGGGVVLEYPSDEVLVRGRPSWGVAGDGGSSPAQGRLDTPDASSVIWDEGETATRASFAPADREWALELLDQLAARPGGPGAGFDPPPAGGLDLLGEAVAPTTPTTLVSTTHGTTTPSGRELRLRVDAMTGDGEVSVGYLTAWFDGARTDDGTAVAWDPGPTTLTAVRPDGRAVVVHLSEIIRIAGGGGTLHPVDEVEGLGPAREVTERVLDGVVPVDAGALDDMWGVVNAERAALPLLARFELPTVDLELRGDDEAGAVCQVGGTTSVCANASTDPDGWVLGTIHIRGQEYGVAGQRRDSPPVFVATDPADPADTTDPTGGERELTAETGRDGDWSVALVARGPDVERLTAHIAGLEIDLP
jgi:hypothetical protein